MLPAGVAQLSDAEVDELARVFGKGGELRAERVKLGCRRISVSHATSTVDPRAAAAPLLDSPGPLANQRTVDW